MGIEDIINTYGAIADFYDPSTGYIFAISAWGRAKRFFGMNIPIEVMDSQGNVVGSIPVDESKIHREI